MSHRKTKDLTGMLIPIGLLGLPALLFLCFGRPDTDSFRPSPDAVDGIVEHIRDRTRMKWLEQVSEINRLATRIEALRQDHFAQIRTKGDGDGDDYLRKFLELSRDTHARIDRQPLDDPRLSLWKAFEAGKSAELELINHYRDIRAAQTAVKLEVSAADAIASVRVVQPQRRTLDRSSLESTDCGRDPWRLDAFKQNVISGTSELDAMVQACRRILEKAIRGETEEQEDKTLVFNPREGLGSNAGETLRPDEVFFSKGTSDGGFLVTPGRIVDETAGTRNDWMYIDKWYVMGPFENRFRSNREASFLPETVVDLDNVTLGKGGQEIRWEYWVRKKLRIEPAWAPRGCVYYGWTEVYMAKAGRHWVALGSDDYGKMWLNGRLVWTSDTTPKTHRADEHMAEMEFQQGVNQVLFHCENNGGTMGWSMVIGTMPNEPSL